jgi:hypothetical protein
MNCGQMEKDVKLATSNSVPIWKISKPVGDMFYPEDLIKKIEGIIEKKEETYAKSV